MVQIRRYLELLLQFISQTQVVSSIRVHYILKELIHVSNNVYDDKTFK